MKKNNNTEVFDPMAWANLNNDNKSNASSVAPAPVSDYSTDTDEEQISSIVNLLVNRGIDITCGYSNWLNLGFALADSLGEGGRAYYHKLSRMNSGYNTAECDKQYSACLRSHGQGVTIKTFFQMAKDAGVDICEVAREAKRKEHEALSLAKAQQGICAKNATWHFGTTGTKYLLGQTASRGYSVLPMACDG